MPRGKVHVFGERLPGPDAAIHLHDRRLYTKLFINPELYAAEAYMDGSLTLEDGAAIHDFLLLFSVNRAGLYSYGSQKLMRRVWRGLRRWHQANPIGLAAAHARHHYDISTELYRLFLDDQMQYSCAYFRDPEHETLEQAQRNKLIYATSKLQLKPGMTVAEIAPAPAGPASPFIWRAKQVHMSPRLMFRPSRSGQHEIMPRPQASPIASRFESWTIANSPASLTEWFRSA